MQTSKDRARLRVRPWQSFRAQRWKKWSTSRIRTRKLAPPSFGSNLDLRRQEQLAQHALLFAQAAPLGAVRGGRYGARRRHDVRDARRLGHSRGPRWPIVRFSSVFPPCGVVFAWLWGGLCVSRANDSNYPAARTDVLLVECLCHRKLQLDCYSILVCVYCPCGVFDCV